MHKILRSHFGEPRAAGLYRQLTSAVQEPRETPQQFFVRAMDSWQKIIFASQESESEMNYDISLVQNMFLHALMTAFSDDNIKSDMKTFLSDKTVSNETLFEQLNTAINPVNERKKKLQSSSRTARINEITSNDVSQSNNKPEKPEKENPFVNEIREMKSEIVAAIRGSVVNKSSSSISEVKAYQKPNRLKPKGGQSRRPMREFSCESCRSKGKGNECDHCFRSGSTEHYQAGCKKHVVNP